MPADYRIIARAARRAGNEIEQLHSQTVRATSASRIRASANSNICLTSRCARAKPRNIATDACSFSFPKSLLPPPSARKRFWRARGDATVLFRESGLPPGNDRCADGWHVAARSGFESGRFARRRKYFSHQSRAGASTSCSNCRRWMKWRWCAKCRRNRHSHRRAQTDRLDHERKTRSPIHFSPTSLF